MSWWNKKPVVTIHSKSHVTHNSLKGFIYRFRSFKVNCLINIITVVVNKRVKIAVDPVRDTCLISGIKNDHLRTALPSVCRILSLQ